MNAIVSPISPASPVAVPPAKGHPFGTDAIYKGYDLMVRRFATHVIRLAQVTPGARADLVRAIGTPAVSFAASAADGSILICCPDGLPDCLNGLAEALETPIQPVGPRLDGMERKLDLLIQDRHSGEHIADRLSALEFTLRDRLDPESRNLALLAQRLDEVQLAVTRIPAPPDLTPLLAGLRQIGDQIAGLPPQDAPLLRVEGLVSGLTTQLQDVRRAGQDGAEQTGAALASLQRLDGRLDGVASSLSGQLSHLQGVLMAGADQTSAASASLLRLDGGLQDLATRIDRHLPELAQDASAQAGETRAAIGAQGDRIAALIDQLATRPQPVPDHTAVVETLTDRMHDLTRSLATGADLTQLATRLHAAIGQPAQAAPLAALGQPAQAEQLAAVAATLAIISTNLTELGQPAQAGQLDAATAKVADLAANLAALGQPAQAAQLDAVLEKVAGRLSAGLAKLGQPAQAVQLEAALDRVAARLSAGFAELGQPAQAGQLDAGMDQVAAQLATQAVQIGQPAQAAHLTAAADQLAASFEMLGQPAQAADLAAASDAIAAKLGAVTAQIGQPAQDTHLTHATDRIAELVAAQPSVPAQDSGLMTTLADLADQIAAVAQRPDPVIDLTLQHQSFARFGLALGQVVQRLETVAEVTQAGPDLTPILNGIESLRAPLTATATAAAVTDLANRIEGLTRATATTPDILAQLQGFEATLVAALPDDHGHAIADGFAALSAQVANARPGVDLTDLTAALAALRSTLSDQLAALVARPDPSQDIAAQKHHLGEFATGLADLVQWLDPVTRDLATGPDFGPILAELATLRQDLTLPAQDLQLGLAQISDQIADLTKSPDGVVSLAEQRQGFASFSNALAFLMQRVDALAPGGAFAADPPQGQALTATLVQRLEDALTAGIGNRKPFESAPAADPAQLIRNIATATTALATLVAVLEGDLPGLPSAATAPVGQLLDRLDRVLPGRDLSDTATRTALTDLSQALHGPGLPKDGFLATLRPDFAERVASALKGQAEA